MIQVKVEVKHLCGQMSDYELLVGTASANNLQLTFHDMQRQGLLLVPIGGSNPSQ